MATLIVVEGPAEGSKFALQQHRIVMIGREANCTFQILDPRMSRRHMQVKRDAAGNGHAAVDFESKSGVEINGKKIEGETLLKDTDIIRIGDSAILYSVEDDPDADTIRHLLRKRGEELQPTLLQ